MSEYVLQLDADDLQAAAFALRDAPHIVAEFLMACAVLADIGPDAARSDLQVLPNLDAYLNEDGGRPAPRWGRLVPIAALAPPQAPRPAVKELPSPPPAPEPIPLRPVPPQRVPGLPKEYPQNIVGQIIHAAGVQIDPLVPLYWHRKEHQIEAVDLVNRSGLSSDALVARIRAAKNRPELRRISQLADIAGGRRG